jgi:hypothetical protein
VKFTHTISLSIKNISIQIDRVWYTQNSHLSASDCRKEKNGFSAGFNSIKLDLQKLKLKKTILKNIEINLLFLVGILSTDWNYNIMRSPITFKIGKKVWVCEWIIAQYKICWEVLKIYDFCQIYPAYHHLYTKWTFFDDIWNCEEGNA